MNDWYQELARPFGTPPNWVFGPVWTTLYVMIAVSIAIYLRNRPVHAGHSVTALLIVHIVSNLIWTPLFFRLQSIALALVDIVILDITLVFLIVAFWKVSKPASILLWPYMLWVTYATYLNVAFLILNRK